MDSDFCCRRHFVGREDRRELILPISVEDDGETIDAKLRNASPGAICFEADASMPIGANTIVALPGHGRIAVQVRWSIGAGAGCHVYSTGNARIERIMSKLYSQLEVV